MRGQGEDLSVGSAILIIYLINMGKFGIPKKCNCGRSFNDTSSWNKHKLACLKDAIATKIEDWFVNLRSEPSRDEQIPTLEPEIIRPCESTTKTMDLVGFPAIAVKQLEKADTNIPDQALSSTLH